ncbi:MAG: DUF302 domain-containing protein [Nevskia sp.]|nr:DUF302 domain-containing protein [Nevskia sp.]
MATDGLISVQSRHRASETAARLAAFVESAGMTVFARIDHAAGAAQAGLTLRPTELLIFGAAKGGTPLMQVAQGIGIDLPLKALVWEDAGGQTWISYNDPAWLAQRHGIGASLHAVQAAMRALLDDAARHAGSAA